MLAPGSNPVLTSGLDLFPGFSSTTLCKYQLVASCQLVGVLNHISVKFELFLSDY